VALLFASFRATATLRIEDPAAFGTSFVPVGWSPNLTPAQNLADSVIQVVKTRAFSQELSDMLKSSNAVSSPAELQQAVASTAAGLKATASGPHLLTLTNTCAHQSVCISVMTDTIDIFKEQMTAIQQDRAAAATKYWSAQLTDAQANLASAQSELANYASAHPGVSLDPNTSDPQAGQLVNNVQLWRGKVTEAQNSLSQAQYLGTASARYLQIGTTVVDTPHLAGSRFVGDYASLIPAAAVLVVGLAGVAAYVFLLGWVDRTAGDPKQLERRLGVPVVATIPRLVGSGGA
jgi:hypothetical protein